MKLGNPETVSLKLLGENIYIYMNKSIDKRIYKTKYVLCIYSQKSIL